LTDLIHDVASGGRGPAPASVIVMPDDVLAGRGLLPRAHPIESAVVQAVCSPIRNLLDRNERRARWGAVSRRRRGRPAARAQRRRPAGRRLLDHRDEPTFDNTDRHHWT
jgi:hypothetical protein